MYVVLQSTNLLVVATTAIMDATVATVAMMHATAISGYATTQNRKLLMYAKQT